MCGSLIHGECCRLSARDKVDQHDDTDTYVIYKSHVLLLLCFSPQNGNTALHYESKNGHPEVVELLLQSHANVNVKNSVSTESPHYIVPFTPCSYRKSGNIFAVKIFLLPHKIKIAK